MGLKEFLTGHVDEATIRVGLAGFFGAVLRWLTLRSDWRTGMIGLAAGPIAAIYLSPIAEPLFSPVLSVVNLDTFQRGSLVGCIVGIIGVALPGLVIDIIAARRKKLDADSDQAGK
jgi:hypothetical protein